MAVNDHDIRALFEQWRDSSQELVAVLFASTGIESCAGRMSLVDDSGAVVSDTNTEIRLTLSDLTAADIALHEQQLKSVTITWPDGRSAFLIARSR